MAAYIKIQLERGFTIIFFLRYQNNHAHKCKKKNQQKTHHPDPINISEIVPNWKKIWKIRQSSQRWQQQFFSIILTCCMSSFYPPTPPLPSSKRPAQTAFENSHFKLRIGILAVNGVKQQQSSADKKVLPRDKRKLIFTYKVLVQGSGKCLPAPSLPALACGKSKAHCPSPAVQARQKVSNWTLHLGTMLCELPAFLQYSCYWKRKFI